MKGLKGEKGSGADKTFQAVRAACGKCRMFPDLGPKIVIEYLGARQYAKHLIHLIHIATYEV